MEGIVWAEEGAELLACFFCLEKRVSRDLGCYWRLGVMPAAIRLV